MAEAGSRIHGAIWDVTPECRRLAQLRVAHQVRHIIPQQWDTAKEELQELLGMLGLLPEPQPDDELIVTQGDKPSTL